MRLAILIFLGVIFAGVAVFFFIIPAFRGEIAVSPFLSLGFLRVRWYGLLTALAVLLGYILAKKIAPKFGIEKNHLEKFLWYLVIFGFLGARIYFVVFMWPYYGKHLLEIFQIWHGGLSLYGGLLGGFLGIVWYAKRYGQSFIRTLDFVALVLPLSQSLGRWGNFFNQEAFGLPTNLPWKLYVSPEARPFEFLQEKYFHPTFLYESLWDLAVFGILLYLSQKSPRKGFLAGSYLILYPLGRFFIEALRLDSFYLSSAVRVDQIASLLAMVFGIGIMFYFQRNEKQA
jgi:phosphatidylglycerol:prolipoprotein diacylglycerol transferase